MPFHGSFGSVFCIINDKENIILIHFLFPAKIIGFDDSQVQKKIFYLTGFSAKVIPFLSKPAEALRSSPPQEKSEPHQSASFKKQELYCVYAYGKITTLNNLINRDLWR